MPYQPNNGMTPEEFQRWMASLPPGPPPLKEGSRKAAVQARRRSEKTVRYQRADGSYGYCNVLKGKRNA